MFLILYIYHHELRNQFICYNVHVGSIHTNWFTLYQYCFNFVDLLIRYWYYEKGLLLQNTTKYNDNVVCLLSCCQINNWHTCNILIRFAIFIRLWRYILNGAILSTYGQSNNNYKQFRRKLGSNSFIWYITTINKILLELCGWWIYDECQIASRSDPRWRHFRVPILNGSKWVLHPYIFSINKWNRFQDTPRLQKKLVWLSCVRGWRGCRCGVCSP